MQLTHSIRKVVYAMSWAAFIFLNDIQCEDKETYGFRSQKPMPMVEELKDFKDACVDLIGGIKWRRNASNPLQSKLKEDIKKINKNPNVIVAADKSHNHYEMEPEHYSKLLHDHITKDYKKSSPDEFDRVTAKDKKLAEDLDLEDRVPVTEKREAFGTLKDGKDNFNTNPKMRLLNPCKPWLGRVSKQLVEKIVTDVQKKQTKLLQFKNSISVIQWFDKLRNKEQYTFIKFDVDNFYSSISEKLLKDTVNWASTITDIPEKTKEIIFQVRNTFLFHRGQTYSKKINPNCDVAMGSFDSAEVTNLVGLYLLSLLAHLPVVVGLYRDDGAVLSRLAPRETENVKKEICRIMKDQGLSITIDANKKAIDFLDVYLDLSTGKYKPFRKPNDVPVYVHAQSNHAPAHIKNIPENVNKRLNILSCNEEVFMEAKPLYQEALIRSGYNYELKYEKVNIHEMNNSDGRRKRSRKRQIFWFNPVFCKRVETNVGAQFLKILDTTIPRGHVLHKLFNRHTVKVSYRTLGNLAKTISTHNSKVLNTYEQQQQQQQQQQQAQQQQAAPLRTRLRRRLQQQDDVVDPAPAPRVADPAPAEDDQVAAPAVPAPPEPAPPAPAPPPTATRDTEPPAPAPRTCNCRAGKENCMVKGPASGNCLQSSVVYGAAVKTTDTTLRSLFGEEEVETVETYTGSCEPTLKARVQGHFSSFRYEKYRHSTRLSRYVHSLKDEEKEYSIDWKVIDKQKSFSTITNMCRLCLAESYAILYGDSASINSKDEIWGHCRHSRKHMLLAAKVRMPAL